MFFKKKKIIKIQEEIKSVAVYDNNESEKLIDTGLELYEIMLRSIKKQGKIEGEFSQNLDSLANKSNSIEESLNYSKESLTNIIEKIENISKASDLTKNSLDESSKILYINNEKVEALNIQTQNLEELYKNYLSIFEEMEEKTKAVEGILKNINAVAYKTNLLSLNAGIEAARAGEAGKGFGVVAQEIKKLADDTHKLSGEIEKNLGTVISNVSHLSIETKEAFEDIEKISKSTEEMKNEFQILLEKDQLVSKQMEDVSLSSQNSLNDIEKINENFTKNFLDIENIIEAMNNIAKQRLEKDIFFSDFTSYLYQLEDIFKEIKN